MFSGLSSALAHSPGVAIRPLRFELPGGDLHPIERGHDATSSGEFAPLSASTGVRRHQGWPPSSLFLEENYDGPRLPSVRWH
jgi:hypothetical protein